MGTLRALARDVTVDGVSDRMFVYVICSFVIIAYKAMFVIFVNCETIR